MKAKGLPPVVSAVYYMFYILTDFKNATPENVWYHEFIFPYRERIISGI
jgi:hypothetical protein